MSASQIDRLGDRLKNSPMPTPEDRTLLEQLRTDYRPALTQVAGVLRAAHIGATSRFKSTNTIIDKVRQGTRLSTMQDIAGLRVVRDMDLIEQKRLVGKISNLLAVVRVYDRCSEPSHGYRAIHLVVSADECPVEIQVRSAVQHAWAELSEKLGDLWGRQVRYGGAPNEPAAEVEPGVTRAQVIDILSRSSELIARGEEAEAEALETEATLNDPDEILIVQSVKAELREMKEELESTMYHLRANLEAL